ncbi:unnamed protein product, partial [marine sediment metagenome]
MEKIYREFRVAFFNEQGEKIEERPLRTNCTSCIMYDAHWDELFPTRWIDSLGFKKSQQKKFFYLMYIFYWHGEGNR